MDRRTQGTILLVISLLLCALPGAILFLVVSFDATSYVIPAFGPPILQPFQSVLFCGIACGMALIPLAVGLSYFAPRSRRRVKHDNEPIPPPL